MTRPSRVLVVEDDVATLEMFQLMLQGWGYIVEGATDGETALTQIINNCPDVVISDLMMPGMDGLELLKRIRAFQPECVVFFILVTGHACVPSAVSAIVAGADEVLIKPVVPDDLLFKLQDHGFYGLLSTASVPEQAATHDRQ